MLLQNKLAYAEVDIVSYVIWSQWHSRDIALIFGLGFIEVILMVEFCHGGGFFSFLLFDKCKMKKAEEAILQLSQGLQIKSQHLTLIILPKPP